MKNISALFIFIFVTYILVACFPTLLLENQVPNINNNFCATTALHELKLADQEWKNRHKKSERKLYKYLQDKSTSSNGMDSDYVLPVVVHIIHNNGPENISVALVEQGIQYLNDAFANTEPYDPSTGVNTEIEFCLAKQDPNGNPTNGITRTQSSLTSLTLETQDITMKDLSRWDPLQYINIWLVGEICSASSGCGVAGYAYFPSSHGNPEDGIVIEAEWMGANSGVSAVLAHEAGHYLGLYHTFQGGCQNADCLSDGDRVCDTPPDQSTAAVPCNTTANSCMTDVNAGDSNNPFTSDQNDMFWNYMDYGDWDCYSAFTQGQTNRMDFFINDVRFSLLDSDACKNPCPNPLTVNFEPSTFSIPAGGTVFFNNTSTNTSSWDWQIDEVNFANTEDASYTFNNIGTFKISLIGENNTPNCSDDFSVTIEVTCNTVAAFDASAAVIEVGESVTFTNTSTSGTSYEWFLDGQFQSTAVDFTNTFNATGVYNICLIASGEFCSEEICFGLVVNNISTDCVQTFIKTYGTTTADERGYSLCPAEDGNIYLASSRQDSALIIKLSPEGETIWERSFLFVTGGVNTTTDLNLDADNLLVGSGFSGTDVNRKGFVFRYDPVNDFFQWIHNTQTANFGVTLFDIIEIIPGGNFLATGQIFSSGSTGCDGCLYEINRNTGALEALNNKYQLGSCETFNSAQIYDGDLFVCGRYNFAGGGTNKMRGAVSRLDLNGLEEWTKLYLVDVADNARLYAPDMLIENDEIIVIQQGDKNGTSITNPEVFITKSDLNGDLIWAKEYLLNVNTNIAFSELISLPDGYAMLGRDVSQNNLFILKTDKDGNFLWSKNYGNTADFRTGAFNVEMLLHDVYLYFTGWTSSLGSGDEDILLGKVNLMDGSINDACIFVEDLTVTVNDFPNPYEGLHNLTNIPNTINSEFPMLNSTVSPLTETTLCSASCEEICDNGIDDDLDGYVDCYDSTCDCEIDNCVETEFETNFAVKLAWESQIDLVAVDATPIIANLNPQVDDIPEIIVGISPPLVTASTSNRLLIFRGDGLNNVAPRELNIQGRYDMYPDAKPVVGDVNADGIPELLIISADRRIRVYSNYSETSTTVMEQIAVSTQRVADKNYVAFLADFDQDGISEVYCGNEVFKFDFSGPSVSLERVLLGTGSIGQMVRRDFQFNACSPIAADLLSPADCSGDPDCNGLEIAAGDMIYSIDIDPNDGDGMEIKIQKDLNVLQSDFNYWDGYTAVADMNLDGILDIVVAGRRDNQYGLYIWDKNGIIQFFPKPVADIDDIFGALPCIANVYDDTQSGAAEDFPEVILTSRFQLLCWNLNAAQISPATPYWWELPTTDGSGMTGVTVFDFNGDNISEIVYRDEDNLRIMYGGNAPFPTGVDVNRNWETFISGSGTFDEHPVVADIDNDKQAEIILTSYTYAGVNTPAGDYRGRLRVFESDSQAGGPWLSARNIWNQYSYFVTNVNDDLSIPIEQQQHHIEFPEPGSGLYPLNNFLAQVPILNDNFIPFLPLPDATVEIVDLVCGLDSFTISLSICNIGDALLPLETPVAFYDGDPQNQAAILHSIELTAIEVQPGTCETINFTIVNTAASTIHAVVNDNSSISTPYSLLDDFPATAILECDYTNNISFFELEGGLLNLDLGPDIVVCQNGVFTFDAGIGFDSYTWQNGETDPTFTAWEPGTYWVEVTGACATILRDTVSIILDEATVVDLGRDTILCDESSLTFSVPGFDDYQWTPSEGLDCLDCETVNASPIISTTYTVVASTDAGCISVDSVTITLGTSTEFVIDTTICDGETLLYNGQMIPSDTSVVFTYQTVEGCDSIVTLNVFVAPFSATLSFIDTVACVGSSVFLENTNIESNSIDTFNYLTINGCDSTIIITVAQLDTFNISENITICAGDAVLIFGQNENTTGIYSESYNSQNGCDSTYQINLTVLSELGFLADILPSCSDDATGSIAIQGNGGLPPYSFQWDIPTVGDTNSISNLAIGEYKLTITDANECTLTSTIEVPSFGELAINTQIIDPTCFGYEDGLLSIDSSFLGMSFSLDGFNYQEGLVFSNLAAGTYTLFTQNAEECVFKQELTLLDPRQLIVQLPRDSILRLGCPIEIKASVNTLDSVSYTWLPDTYLDCIDCPSINAVPLNSTTYMVNVMDSNLCQASDTIQILIEKPRDVYIPNVFSPNGDGINDAFLVYTSKEVDIIVTLKVFDRWGELVFEGNDFPPNLESEGWTGVFKEEAMNPGVFVYIAVVRFLDGAEIQYSGDVTLLR